MQTCRLRAKPPRKESSKQLTKFERCLAGVAVGLAAIGTIAYFGITGKFKENKGAHFSNRPTANETFSASRKRSKTTPMLEDLLKLGRPRTPGIDYPLPILPEAESEQEFPDFTNKLYRQVDIQKLIRCFIDARRLPKAFREAYMQREECDGLDMKDVMEALGYMRESAHDADDKLINPELEARILGALAEMGSMADRDPIDFVPVEKLEESLCLVPIDGIDYNKEMPEFPMKKFDPTTSVYDDEIRLRYVKETYGARANIGRLFCEHSDEETLGYEGPLYAYTLELERGKEDFGRGRRILEQIGVKLGIEAETEETTFTTPYILSCMKADGNVRQMFIRVTRTCTEGCSTTGIETFGADVRGCTALSFMRFSEDMTILGSSTFEL